MERTFTLSSSVRISLHMPLGNPSHSASACLRNAKYIAKSSLTWYILAGYHIKSCFPTQVFL